MTDDEVKHKLDLLAQAAYEVGQMQGRHTMTCITQASIAVLLWVGGAFWTGTILWVLAVYEGRTAWVIARNWRESRNGRQQ